MKSAIVTYGFTVAGVALAGVIRWLLSPILGDHLPFPTFFVTVAVTAWLGGLRPALLATLLGLLAVTTFFGPRPFSEQAWSGANLLGLAMYLTVCLVFAGFGEATRRSNTRLSENAERLRTTLASIGDGVITTDTRGQVTNLNAVAESLTGWSNAEAAGQSIESVFRIVDEASRDVVQSPVLRAIQEKAIVSLASHSVLIAKDGTERAIDDSAAPIRHESGEVIGCVLIFRDIGKQRQLQREATALSSIVQHSEDAIISKSLEGVIQSWNAAAERLFGYTAAQAIGRPMSLVIPNERDSEEKHIIAQMRAGNRIEHFETMRLTSDGKLIPVSLTISPMRDETGNIVGASKIVRDMSERKLSEEKLRASEALKSAMISNALDCVISIDHEGKIIEFNPAAERTFGYRREEVLGEQLADLIIPSHFREQHRQGMLRYMATGTSRILNQRLELSALRSDGSEFPVELAITRIPMDGPPIFNAYLRDITERKQEQATHAERTRLVSLRADVNHALSSMQPSQSTLQVCCEALVKYLDVAFARVWTLDEAGSVLELQASAGLYTHLNGPHSRVPVGEFKIGRIASNRQAHLTNSVATDPQISNREWAVQTGMVSFAGYPLIVEDRVVGVVAMFARHPLSDSVLTELEPLADGIAQFLDRRRAEEAFRRQAELHRVTLVSIGDAVITTDVTAKITQLNTVAELLTGWKNDEARGQPLDTVFRIVNEASRHLVQNPATKALHDGVIVGLANHTILIAKDGTERPIDDSAAPIYSSDGELVGCVLVFRDISERKQAEQKIEAARSRLESTLVAGEIGTWDFDIVKNNITVDPNLARLLGVTPQEAEGSPLELFMTAIHPGDSQRVGAALGHAIEQGSSFETECRIVGTGGDVRWVVARGRVHRDANGKALRLPGVVVDITGQKTVESELRASEERRRIALDSAELGAWHIDPATSSLISDERFQTIFSGSVGAISLEDAFAFIHAEDRQRIRDAVKAASHPDHLIPYAEEYRVVHRDGSIRWVFGKGRANFEDGNVSSFDGTVADITDRKRSEELIRESELRLRFILDSMPQKVFTATAEGEVDYFNPVWMDFTGLAYEEIKDHGWIAFTHPEDLIETLRVWKNSIATGNSFQCEHRFVRSDGEPRWHVSRATALKDNSGNIAMWVGANTDIHEQRQTADELRVVAARLSEAGHRKDEFLATLAHELRNPLAPIRTGLQVMKLARDDVVAVEQSRTMMERQLEQMVRLVDDLMDVSRISRGKLDLKLQRIELASVIYSAIETSRPLLEKMGQVVVVALPPKPMFISADFTRLAQVFLNLLNNAAKYSDERGQIEIRAERQHDEVVVSVKDSGIGIAEDQLLKIFEMFSQVDRSLEKSQGGLGIGLTLVRRIVELHGGSVCALSEGIGTGSEFIVRLPVGIETDDENPVKVNDSISPAMNDLRILIVDDNRDSADSLSTMLRIMGNTTSTAYDGEEALIAAHSFQPNVILLDIGLPKLNGYEVCRRIREFAWGKEILIIAQTGWGQEEDRRRTHDAGFDHHRVKPVDPAELMQLISKKPPT